MFWDKETYDLVKWAWRKYANVKIEKTEVNNETMVYLEGNHESKEVVVMLHGITADKYVWPMFARKFVKNGYRVVIPDLPPFGESSYNKNIDYSIEYQAKNLKIFLENLNIKKFHIMGNSMGGGIAAKFTILYPEMINSLVLFDNMGIYSVKKTKFLKNLEEGKRNLMLIKNRDELDIMLKLVYHKVPFIPFPIREELLREGINNYDKNKHVFGNLLEENWNLEDELDKINIPAFIIWGKYDDVFDISTIDVMSKGIKNSQSFIVDNCGHMPMNEKSGISSEKILNFLKELNQRENV